MDNKYQNINTATTPSLEKIPLKPHILDMKTEITTLLK
jgi:hypothetical protein